MENYLETFKLYFTGKKPIDETNRSVTYRADSAKDVKHKIKRALKFIGALSLPLKVVAGENNTYTIKPFFG